MSKCNCPVAHCHCGGHLSIVCENGCADAEISLNKPNAIAVMKPPRAVAARRVATRGFCECGRPRAKRLREGVRHPTKCEMHRSCWYVPVRDYIDMPATQQQVAPVSASTTPAHELVEKLPPSRPPSSRRYAERKSKFAHLVNRERLEGHCECGRPTAPKSLPLRGGRSIRCEVHQGMWRVPFRDYLEQPATEEVGA